MLEYTYGIAERWEAGLQLPLARWDEGWASTGFDIEVQHVLPHADERPYWGARASVGRKQVPGEPGLYRAELLGIVGYKLPNVHLTLNPGSRWAART